MVRHNFSLNDVRNLYIDEFIEYYQELIYLMEEVGELEKGTYEKVTLSYKDDSVDRMFDFFSAKINKSK